MDSEFLSFDWRYIGLTTGVDRPLFVPWHKLGVRGWLLQEDLWRPYDLGQNLRRDGTERAAFARYAQQWDALREPARKLMLAAEAFYEQIPRRDEQGFLIRNISAAAGVLPLAERDKYETEPFTDEVAWTNTSEEPQTDYATGQQYYPKEIGVRRTRHVQVTPEEAGLADPDNYLKREAVIEEVYRSETNPLAFASHREWLARYIVFLYGESERAPHAQHAAFRGGEKRVHRILSTYYEWDHRALVTAKKAQNEKRLNKSGAVDEQHQEMLEQLTRDATTFITGRRKLDEWVKNELAKGEREGMDTRQLSELKRHLDQLVSRQLEILGKKFGDEAAKR